MYLNVELEQAFVAILQRLNVLHDYLDLNSKKPRNKGCRFRMPPPILKRFRMFKITIYKAYISLFNYNRAQAFFELNRNKVEFSSS